MPIYEYRCTGCDHRLEKLQRMVDEPLKECPQCNQLTLKKLVSAAAFKLKGSGWYETDFKNKDGSSTSTESKSKVSETSDSKTTSSTKKTTSKPVKEKQTVSSASKE